MSWKGRLVVLGLCAVASLAACTPELELNDDVDSLERDVQELDCTRDTEANLTVDGNPNRGPCQSCHTGGGGDSFQVQPILKP